MRSSSAWHPGHARTARAIARRLAAAIAGAVLVLAAAGGAVLAATPSPTTGAAGDPRSGGQGPGLVGDPLVAILVVAAIGVVSLVVTLVYVRATGGPRSS